MSTSDSNFSIDWLASDEDDGDSPKRLSPQLREEPPVPPPSPPSSSSSSSTSASSASSASPCRESPTSSLPSELHRRRRRRRRSRSDCNDEGCHQDSELSPVQGFTSICAAQTVPMETKHRSSTTPSDGPDAQTDTESELFSQKCRELQGYVQPLSSILQGLRSGRYSDRLSSFQESVAMDRIQRIMGVLQNPNMGGRFLRILLKVEEMLLSWFPHIRTSPTHWDHSAPAKKHKPHHSSASSLSGVELAASSSSTHLKWLHTTPICSLKTPEQPTPAESTGCTAARLEATQDAAVSSSTDSLTPCLHRLPFKVSSPCLQRLLQAKDSIVGARMAAADVSP